MSIDFNQVITAEAKQAAAAEALVASIRQGVDAAVESVAKAKGYNSAAHCASYATSTVTAWADEAADFVAWRDAVWLFVFSELAEVQAGTKAPPASGEAFVATLPAAPW